MILYFIIGYFVVGVILNFVGPAGRSINKGIKRSKIITVEDFLEYERIPPKATLIAYRVILRGTIILFWPIIYFIIYPYDYLFGSISKDRKTKKQGKKDISEQPERNEKLFIKTK